VSTPAPAPASPREASRAPGILRIFPDLSDDLLLQLFHKGVKAQWTSRDLDWTLPIQMDDRQRRALARLLTPVYIGEQTAMVGASGLVPQLMSAGETTAQLYITSFMMDEARHFEALTRLYRTLGHDPMRLRELPEMLRYHHRLRQGDRVDWVWGIFISDLYAKLFYRSFVVSQPEALFGRLSARIIQDESRHQAFAVHYLRRNLPHLGPARRRALVAMRDELYGLVEYGAGRLRDDCDALGFDGDLLLQQFWTELGHFSRHLGLDGSAPDDGPPDDGSSHGPGDGLRRAASPDERSVHVPAAAPGSTNVDHFSAPAIIGGRGTSALPATAGEAPGLLKCFGCLLAFLCPPRRLHRAQAVPA
jgi:hypothetical protein